MSIVRRRLKVISIVFGVILLWISWVSDLPAVGLPDDQPGQTAAASPFFTVAQIRYTLDPGDPAKLARIRLDLQTSTTLPASALVQAKLINASTTYVACEQTASGSSEWECPTGGVAVNAVDELSIKLVLRPGDQPYVVFIPVVHKGGHVNFFPLTAKQ